MWLQAEEKRRQAELAEEEQRREEAAREAAARRQRRLARRKADAGRRVPPEPTTPTTPADVCRILVRLPAGRKLERRFHRHQHTLQVLFFFNLINSDFFPNQQVPLSMWCYRSAVPCCFTHLYSVYACLPSFT